MAGLGPLAAGALAPGRALAGLTRRSLLGRRPTVTLGGTPVALTVTGLALRPHPAGLVAGHLGDLRLAARDVVWPRGEASRLTLTARDARLVVLPAPALVAGPVLLAATVPGAVVSDLVRASWPWLTLEVGADRLEARSARRPGLGRLEVDPTLAGSTVRLSPTAAVTDRTRVRLPGRTPGVTLRLPALPGGLELDSVAVRDGDLHLTGTVDAWRLPLGPDRLSGLLRRTR